jgi:hypothetical protein
VGRGSEELEAAGLSDAEAEAVAVPESGLTTGGGAHRISQGYLHTVHPDTGNDVVFVPGEALPDWAVKVQNEQRADAAAKAVPGLPESAKGKRSVKSTVDR